MVDEDDELEAICGARPRRWHYEFAHILLPRFLFEKPDAVVSALNDPQKSPQLISAIMDGAAVDSGLSPEESDSIADSISIHRHRNLIHNRIALLLVLEMPPPIAVAECHFVAIVYKLDRSVHYFTLERAFDDPAKTQLCSWDAEQVHSNFGDGPPADADRFADAVREMTR
jgi:hypothetical protein